MVMLERKAGKLYFHLSGSNLNTVKRMCHSHAYFGAELIRFK